VPRRRHTPVRLLATALLVLAAGSCSDDEGSTATGSGDDRSGTDEASSSSGEGEGEDEAGAEGGGGSTATSTADGEEIDAGPEPREAEPSAGCDAPAAVTAGEPSTETLDVDGQPRTYRRYVPAGLPAGEPVPLVLDLHGLNGNSEREALVSAWETLAADEGFVVLTPQGAGAPPRWEATPTDGNPDTAFLGELIDETGRQLCIDTTRVYSGGISNGGLESSVLACTMPEKLAAVGLVSGIRVHPPCASSPPMPAIIFWGKRDCILPYYGGLGPCFSDPNGVAPTEPSATPSAVPPVEDSVAAWAERNGCAASPEVEAVSEHVELRTFTSCTDGTDIHFYVIANGGHTWPGSAAAIARDQSQGLTPDDPQGIATDEIDATRLMWDFYQRFQTRP
jgi:polyhydroxybutyrate depolymerase